MAYRGNTTMNIEVISNMRGRLCGQEPGNKGVITRNHKHAITVHGFNLYRSSRQESSQTRGQLQIEDGPNTVFELEHNVVCGEVPAVLQPRPRIVGIQFCLHVEPLRPHGSQDLLWKHRAHTP